MLYAHQQKVVDKNPARHLLAHSTGTGKTNTAIALADKNCRTCLVIVPKALKKKWERDLGTFSNTNCGYVIYTKEEFKRDWRTLPKYDGVIVDEAHYFAGLKSQLTKSLYNYMKKQDIKYRWLLTATPYLSTPMNIYTLARHLGYEWNYWTFQQKYFDMIRMGMRMVPKPKKNIETQLALVVKQIGSTVDMEEAVALTPELGQIPEQVFETEYFDLTDEQKEGIKNLNDDLFITRWTHAHCIENGILYSDGYTETQIFLSKKTPRFLEICRENKKVAIFCRYTEQIKMLKFLTVTTHPKCKTFVIDGSSSGEERDSIVRQAEACDEAIIFIQSQCSAGYELPSFNTIVFMSMSFSYVDYVQGIGRFLRINNMSKNRYIHLVSNGVDRDVYDSIMRKQDFSLAIYDK